MRNKRLQSLIDFPLRDVLRGLVTSPIPSIGISIKWLLTNVLNLTATRGPSAVAGGTSGTWIEVWDLTLGKVLKQFSAGIATSPGQRDSFDTDEGATLGSELVDDQTAATGWSALGSNTVEQDGDEVKITSVDNTNGASLGFRDSEALNTDLTVGATYRVAGFARVDTGDSVDLLITGPNETIRTVTETLLTPFSHDFTATSATFNTLRQGNMGVGEIIWVSDVTLKLITPTFLNTVSKADSTKLHPTKQLTENGVTSTVFLVHQAWPGAAQSVDANSYAVGKNGNHWYYFQADSGGGTTGGSEPTWPDTLDATVVDNDITWTNKGRYSNIGPGYLPHVLSIPTEQTQYLLNSNVPATQTTGSLANGDYVLWQNGAGSSDLTAGTATISTTGSATDGSPLTFSVTSPGTVTVTITGLPDENQLENGDFPTVFILSGGSTVVRDADSFTSTHVPETGKDRWRLALENLGAQTIVSDGTNTLSYSGTAVEFTDGVTTLSHIVVPVHGDFVGLDEDTGALYYNGSSVDVDGALDVTWSSVTDINNVTDITDDSDLDLTDTAWDDPE